MRRIGCAADFEIDDTQIHVFAFALHIGGLARALAIYQELELAKASIMMALLRPLLKSNYT